MSLSRLIGCVWMQRSGAMPCALTSSTSPVVARSKNAPSSRRQRDYRRVRQRLQRVVQVDAGQRRLQRVVLATHLFAIDDQQRRAETGGQPADFGFRERGRIEGMSGRNS